MARFKLLIEYAGTRYSGWQIQKNARTVQGEIDRAIREALRPREFELYGSGRTDAGVHAIGQIAHLDIYTAATPEQLRRKLKDEYVGLPGQKLKELRESGIAVTAETQVPLLCYTGDTGPGGLDADPAVYRAKVLITEMSFARTEHSRERIHQFGHLHLDDFADRADRFENELIIAAHVTSRDEPAVFHRLIQERLPAGLRERVKVWGAD